MVVMRDPDMTDKTAFDMDATRNASLASATDSMRSKQDSIFLARMGKKQVLKRRFGTLSLLGFSCTILSTWEGVLGTFGLGFNNGGTLGIIGQFVLAWGGTLCTFIAMGELASMAPTAAGQYHWVAMLSPRSMRDFLSYLTGWMTCLAWVTTITTGSFYGATLIQSIAVLDHPSYAGAERPWQVCLILIAIVLLTVLLNTVMGTLLPHLEGSLLIIHILGFFGVLIPLVYYAPKTPASEIFGQPYGHMNGGDWPTYGLSFMIGMVGCAGAFVGADGAVHMSEEIFDASISVPRSIFISVILNGLLGLGVLIAALFCMGEPKDVLEAAQTTTYPIIEIFVQATHSVAGSTVMISILIIATFAGTIGAMATASRMIFSFSRDRGLPFSNIFSRVSDKSKIPILAVLVTSIVPCALGLINLGSTTVFQQVTSWTLVGFYSTYLICCVLLLWHRLRGSIMDPEPGTMPPPAFKDEKSDEYVLTWGRWHWKGWMGTANNVIAVCYLTSISFFGFWPNMTPVDASTMSYTSLVWGGTMLFSLVYYVVWGKRQYKGPVVEIVI